MKDNDGADEYSAARGHLTAGRRSSAAVEEREGESKVERGEREGEREDAPG